jgi:hypothetical protein
MKVTNDMKTNKPLNEVEESTYSLLIRSEEKTRAISETIIYGLIILSAIAAILQFAAQPDIFPLASLPGGAPV